MTTELLADRATMVGKIHELFRIREAKNEATKDDKKLTDQFKQYMALNDAELDHNEKGDPYLDDGEHGLRAILASKKTTTWDLRRAPVDVILYLAHAGLLTVSTSDFDSRRRTDEATQLDDAMNYRHEGVAEGMDGTLRFEVIK